MAMFTSQLSKFWKFYQCALVIQSLLTPHTTITVLIKTVSPNQTLPPFHPAINTN